MNPNYPEDQLVPPTIAEATQDAQIDPSIQASLNSAFSSRISELEEQVKQGQDQLLRALAEAENVRNRANKDAEEKRKFAVSGLVQELIDVLENLFRTTSYGVAESGCVTHEILGGIALTQEQFLNVLAKHGVRRILPQIGEQFDHNAHQAISRMPSNEYPENSVLQVVQAGYFLHERLIKPAIVIVSSAQN